MRVLPPSGRWTAEHIFQLFNAPDAVEWRDRVGVVGRRDGSAKPTTRLLLTRGWVAKTHIDQAHHSFDDLQRRVLEARKPGLDANLWHEDKQWLLVRRDHSWYPVTLCPELQTLRQVQDATDRMRGWTDMICMAITTYNQHEMGLDLNPANFGRVDGQGRLYYIDDELYPTLTERDLAGTLIARIPEEPELDPSAWVTWSTLVFNLLEQTPLAGSSWDTLCDELQSYPVTSQFEPLRAMVVDTFKERLRHLARERRKKGASTGPPRLTCVFADVHANLPALEATLEAAGRLGADSYLFVGDVVGYGPHPAECMARIADLRGAILLRGNHDHAVATGRLDVGMNRLARRCAEWTMDALNAEQRSWLGQLSVEMVEETWMAVHGAPRDPRKFFAYVYELTYEDNLRYLEERSVPLCFYGHTHVQLAHVQMALGPEKLEDVDRVDLSVGGPTLINPGSVGQPRDGDPRAAFVLWDRDAGQIAFHRTEYDVDRTVQDLRRHDLPAELGERLQTGK